MKRLYLLLLWATVPCQALLPVSITSYTRRASYIGIRNSIRHYCTKKSEEEKDKIDNELVLVSESLVDEASESLENNSSLLVSTPQIGIGGKDGIVYDVNKLKRNLVQETVIQYKRELWNLLGTPSASLDQVQDRLAALLQANPISTTTDSNLLDGGEWSFAIKSRQAANVLLDSDRFLNRGQETTALWGAAEKMFSTNARQYFLEDLKEDESPFVLDRTVYLGGALSRARTYNVTSLTRTKMDLDIAKVQWNLFGSSLINKCYMPKSRQVQAIQILYIDSNLMISCDQGLDFPYSIYTKSPEWTARAQRMKRKLRLMAFFVDKVKRYSDIPALRRRAIEVMQNRFKKERVEEVQEPNLMMVQTGDGISSLKVLKLGDSAADDAWEGDEDPFVNLSADERQKKLKTMNVSDVEKAGKEQQKRTEQEKKRVILERKRIFKKPNTK